MLSVIIDFGTLRLLLDLLEKLPRARRCSSILRCWAIDLVVFDILCFHDCVNHNKALEHIYNLVVTEEIPVYEFQVVVVHFNR